jgi:tRNA threonylcarbamoyladenosine biosynthesis protein TsaE
VRCRENAQMIFKSNRLEDTQQLAGRLAELAGPGSVLVLDGDLGAGKTAFSQAFARAFGVEEHVNSPTFTIIKEYEGRLPFYHMDVYRLSEDEADELGLDEYFYGEGVTLVEWGSLIDELLPEARLHLFMEVLDADERHIYIYGQGAPYEQWAADLKENGV